MLRVAQSELEKIARARAKIAERLEAHDREGARLRGEDARLQERANLLEQIVSPGKRQASDLPAEIVLSGRRLREEAVRILLGSRGANRATHYRDWYDMVLAAGFVIIAKKPTATFLTAVSRSPVIRRGDEPGTYYVDPTAARELASQLSEIDAELTDVKAVLARETNPAPALTEHRVRLQADQRRLHARLAESEAVLGGHADVVHMPRKRSVA